MLSPIAQWRNKEKYKYLGKIGKIVSFTKINNPPDGFGDFPYYAGIIKLTNGEKKIAQLVLESKVPKIGDRVKGVIRKIGIQDKEAIINYGVKFKLI